MARKMCDKKVGFTIGKFAPFHKGHEYLIETALKDMDEFYVVVYDTPELNIDINKKIKWIKNRFPNVNIFKAFNSPKQYGLDEESVKTQMEYLTEIIKDINMGYFYSSEEYGKYVAQYLDIKNVIVDKNRVNCPIHAGMIRSDLEKYKSFLNKQVWNDLIEKKKD